jgi:hypothetical protein
VVGIATLVGGSALGIFAAYRCFEANVQNSAWAVVEEGQDIDTRLRSIKKALEEKKDEIKQMLKSQ